MSSAFESFHNQTHLISLWAASSRTTEPKESRGTKKGTSEAAKKARIPGEGDFMATLVGAKMSTSKTGNEIMVLTFRAPEGDIIIHVQTVVSAFLGRDLDTWASIMKVIGRSAKMCGTNHLENLHILQGVLARSIAMGKRLSIKILRRKQADGQYYDHILLPETAVLAGPTMVTPEPRAKPAVKLIIGPMVAHAVEVEALAPEPILGPVPEIVQEVVSKPAPVAQSPDVNDVASFEAPMDEPQSLPSWGKRTTLILDWPCIAKAITYSILSGTIPCVWPTEPEEIGHRIMKFLAAIRQSHAGPIVIVQDSKPYWRTSWLVQWCTNHGQEPVIYKGDREVDIWRYATPKIEMEALYQTLLAHVAASIGATVVEAPGMEADDIWSLLVVTAKAPVVGITSDEDWGQLITADGRTRVWDLCRSRWMSAQDIQIKWIGGDTADGIPGLTRRHKDGMNSGRKWGPDGANTLLDDPAWESRVDPEELERNHALVTIPCPLWDSSKVVLKLRRTDHEVTDQHWATYGVTPSTRKQLEDPAVRQAYLEQLRLHFPR